MTSWPFKARVANCDGVKDNSHVTSHVNYSVGQPMGMYSSWPGLAITNHVLVRLSGVRAGIDKFCDYFVLGDDLVIFNPKVASEYIKICQHLGISTKDEDSIHPKQTHTLEVAKRLFRRGVEVSPLPFRLMRTNFGLFSLVCIDRGHSARLVKLYPGDRDKTISLTAAILLTVWKILPK